jgi:nickel-type superoxide dismutase maturation protease
MQPTLKPGDRVLVRRLRRKPAPSLGSVVVTWHPQRSELRLIKRLSRVDSTGLWLLGDNPTESTDSRQLGAVPTNLLIGEVVGRLPLGESEQSR